MPFGAVDHNADFQGTLVRLASWNCARGPLAKKIDALHTLNPDVAVLCEATPPSA